MSGGKDQVRLKLDRGIKKARESSQVKQTGENRIVERKSLEEPNT